MFELYSAQELLNCDIQANGYFFSKIICYGKLYCNTFYKRAPEIRRNNYTVSLSNDRFGEINSFFVIKKTEIAADSEYMIAFVNFFNVSKTKSVIGSHPACAGALAKHILIFTGFETEVKAVNINTLLSTCITYSYENKSYIFYYT